MINDKQRALLSTVLKRVPGGSKLLDLVSSYRLRNGIGVGGRRRPKDIFTYIYEQRRWGRGETVSGPGSTLQYTQNIRQEIPKLILELNIRRLLDAPCGDYNWFRLVPRVNDFEYVGGDIVSTLVQRNQEVFGNAATTFLEIDIISQPIPSADMWLCRDALFHFSNKHVFETLANVIRSDVRYFLTSSYISSSRNTDIPTGYFRQLNLELPPFSLGMPITCIDDWAMDWSVRKLCLWERSALAERLRANVAFSEATKSS
jgi:hypothetical protein